jgi:hypothetical protein
VGQGHVIYHVGRDQVNKVDWEVDLTAGDGINDDDGVGGFPRAHNRV